MARLTKSQIQIIDEMGYAAVGYSECWDTARHFTSPLPPPCGFGREACAQVSLSRSLLWRWCGGLCRAIRAG